MEFKKLQRLIDKGITVLSDHDDKKDEERYKKLQESIEESQDFIEKNNYSLEIDEELRKELIERIAAFKESKIIFILFLIILCGLLFVGVFYISYSHFYDHWYDGGHYHPIITPTKPHKTRTTKKHTTEKQDTTVKQTTSVVTTTKPVVIEPDFDSGFVTVLFDNSNLFNLENVFPVDDNVGLASTPITWKLDSTLSNGSKNYLITYVINFVDESADISINELLDINKLKFQLLAKKDGVIVYSSDIQLLKDYPEVETGIRPIIIGETYANDETLEFELRMWLDSSTDNSQQGKKYRFSIDVEATYEFIE